MPRIKVAWHSSQCMYLARSATWHTLQMLEPGTPLPHFTATDDQGRPFDSQDLLGKWTALWWYVQADTPG
jgi:cytochrome oxidase Cu insertion factor (SCO1/SenC/PrrC family)